MRFAGLTLLLALALPTPALAANADVKVDDDFFAPATVQIQPGDSVTWRWDGSDQHNVKTFANQTESFRSAFMSGSGKAFSHTFARPGRFTYYCEIHPQSMRAAVEVGPPPFPDTVLPRITALKAKVSGRAVKLGFRISEPAKVKLSLSGPSKKTLTKSFGKGARSITLRHLRRGPYKASLRATDKAGNRGRAVAKRFSVR